MNELARVLALAIPVQEKAHVEHVRKRVLALSLPNPDAGADFVYTVPATAIAWPLSVIATLDADGAGTDRGVWIEYRDSTGSRFLVAGAPVTVAPGTSQTFCWHPAAGTPSWPVDDVAVAPLPVQPLAGGYKVAVVLGGVQAADQLRDVRLCAEFEYENPDDL
jgi:hypothetical protein